MSVFPFPNFQIPGQRPKVLVAAIRRLLASGMLLGSGLAPARAELPVPADVLVAPGAGNVLAPVINGNSMTIRQLSDKATLDWKSFNIGSENSVHFDQPSSTSVALNNIHQGDPSRIYGSLTANGQVYLVNQNGFVFGKDARINVNALVASTLNISEKTFQLGLVQAFDQARVPALQATDSAGNPVKSLYLKDPAGRPVLDERGEKVKIQIFVEQGASLKTNAAGGRIILAAPSITNKGDIEAKDGQVILAASQDKVYLQQANAESGVRGMLVEVGTGGDVNNIGKVLAERGNASLIGFAVNQQGLVSATTSVRLNGSVRLLAREGIQDPVATGGALRPAATKRDQDGGDGLGTRASVTLAKGSVTSVELDANKAETAVDAQAQAQSRIEIAGQRIVAESRSEVRAKSGQVSLEALDNPAVPAAKGDARIYLDEGSRIDVSGVKNVTLPMSRNTVELELRSNELRDAPLQRGGVLHGRTVTVDVREIGKDGRIPIADMSGALDRVARNIDERSTAGGSIGLSASGDVITRPGSVQDFSGGSVAYQSGDVETTQLVSGNLIFDLAHADPDRHYDGILGRLSKLHRKWGIREFWAMAGPALSRFEPGYVEGKAGGSLNLAAYNAMLDGLMNGETIAGEHQRLPEEQAQGSTLSIDLNKNNQLGRQDVAFARHAVTQVKPGDPFPQQEGSAVPLALSIDPALLRGSGVSRVQVKTNGTITVPEGERVELPRFGALDLQSGGFQLGGTIDAPSGDVSLKPITAPVDGQAVPLPSSITLGSAASILARGEWVNDTPSAKLGGGVAPVAIDGGHVSLVTEQGDLVLEPGSRIDVSAGAWMQADSKVTAGKGGSISLTAKTSQIGKPASAVKLDGEVSGWALNEGGSLTLESAQIAVGSTDDPAALVLGADFFQQGGFADYRLVSNQKSLTVAPGESVKPLQKNLILRADAAVRPSGESLRAVSEVVTVSADQRNPANLSLSLSQATVQDREQEVRLVDGASIIADRGAAIALSSDTSVIVEGAISAPAGHIALNVTPPGSGDSGYFASQGIWLGSNAQLSAKGIFQRDPNGSGLVTGTVHDGGSVALDAARGYIVAREGSDIDVSGTVADLQFATAPQPGATPVETRAIPSAGGTISLSAGEGIVADGGFSAAAGGAGAAGGSLSVELNAPRRAKPADPIPGGLFPDDRDAKAPRAIVVSALPGPFAPAGLGVGGELPAADFSGRAFLSAGGINDAGFDSVQLKTDALRGREYVGSIQFRGDVSLEAGREIVLDTPVLAAAGADGNAAGAGRVSFDAPHVALGSTQSRLDTRSPSGVFTSTLAPEAQSGNGHLQVAAQGIDLVGGLSLDGFGQADLESAGAIRAIGSRVTIDTKNYLGEFKIAGNLNLRAAQIYPATLTDYAFRLAGADSVLGIADNGDGREPVLSAGGSLTLSAGEILQGGTLLAPFGQLNLEASKRLELAAGSLTSVSGNGATVPFGRGSGGLNWLYPLDGIGVNNRVIEAPPEKRIAFDAPAVDLKESARVDLSGGGDLYAYEFITGPGGTRDVLDATDAAFTEKYAVIPDIAGISTPFDPAEFPASGLRAGDSVYLSGGSGLAPGRYTLLPAHYALLPGAYLVRPVAGTVDMDPAQSFRQMDGATVVAGRYGVAGTRILDARWQGFAVEPGAVARTRSQFQDYSADAFFAAKAEKAGTPAPRLPRDSGSLAVSVDTEMTLAGDLIASAGKDGLGGNLDISASRLAIVGRREELAAAAPGTVSLLADDLNRLQVESLLLGGLRSDQGSSQRLTVVSDSVEVGGGAALSGQEIVIAAKGQVALRSGATVESTSTGSATARDLTVTNRVPAGAAASGDGALVRVSALGQVEVTREGTVSGQSGVLAVESGATLKSDGAMLLDSTQDTRFAGDILMSGGSLALKARAIGVGDAPAGTPGLVLPSLSFNLDELKLTSAGDLSLYGGAGISAKNLFIDAAGIQGFGGDSAASVLSADVIGLGNQGAASTVPGTGSGTLALDARLVRLGDGEVGMAGFRQVTISASEALVGNAGTTGRLRVNADLGVSAGHVAGGDGATSAIDASGHTLNIQALAPPEKTAETTGLGASWTLSADGIASAGRFDLPSGALTLRALQGNLQLEAGTQVDLSGQARNFGDLTRFSPAGSLLLESITGDVNLASGAVINLAGAPSASGTGSDAGQLDVRAPAGSLRFDASVSASAAEGARQGQVSMDVAGLVADDFASLNRKLAAGGFGEALQLRQRSGDIVLPAGETVQAHRVSLAADAGSVRLDGRIDASGSRGGEVEVHASKGLALGDGASIDAHANAADAAGGRLVLDTVRKGSGTADSGLLDLSHTASIDVSAGAGGQEGEVHLRTGRNAGSLAITDIDTQIRGDSQVALEAVRVYDNQTVVDAPAISGWQADTAAYMAAAAAPVNASGAKLVLAPGLDIRSGGDLAVNSPWDFMTRNPANGELLWRYQGVPGYLRLEAADDLAIDAPISDGFATAALPDPVHGTLRGLQFQDVLQPGASWSFSLNAGRDVKLAATHAGAGEARQVVVRTGTGRIDVQAGRDIRLEMDPTSKVAAAVYTMGRPADYTFGDLLTGKIPGIAAPAADQDLSQYLQELDPVVMSKLLRWGYFNEFNVGFGFLAEYPTQGGDISLSAGGDVIGAQTGQLASDWLVRSGTWTNDPADTSRRPTAWGINISGSTADETAPGVDAAGNAIVTNVKGRRFFNQNVGALGGGEVTVSAGGNVENLSVMVPTTGKPFGNLTTPQNGGKPDLRAPDGAFDTRWMENGTQVGGGGDIRVEAGGNILGGEYYTGQGTGTLHAGDSISAGTANLGPAVGLGDAQVSLQARKDVLLSSAFNPTLLPQKQVPDRATQKNAFFFTYGPGSALDLAATGGTIVLQNDVEALRTLRGYAPADGNGFELSVYPGTLKATALSGDIRIDNSLNLYPSATGQLELLAGNSIGTGLTQDGIIKLNMSDADPSLLANPQLPDAGLLGDLPRNIIRTRERLDAESPNASVIHAVVPVHQGDAAPVRLIAQNGDVAFPTGVQMKLFLPKAAQVTAGRDIKNLSLSAQNLAAGDIEGPSLSVPNLAAGDITRLQAGRDILFDARLDANGGVIPADQRLQVGGSGRLQVVAGRDINLGSSSGVLTVGNLSNPALSGSGAAIDVLAGVSDRIDYAGFIEKYLAVDSAYLKDLTVVDGDGNDISSTLTPEQKLAHVEGLSDQAKLGVVEAVLFAEIKRSAAAAAAAPESKREALYSIGFDAIKTLFPGDQYKGDLALVFSQVKTLVGGDINIAAPGGQVDVGLAGKVGGIQKAPDQLGIVVQQQGNLNAVSQGDFNVNQSRVFTMGGGDIVVWSSAGSIDAGKGAKSAISAPPVTTGLDEKGNIVTIFPPIISGSGIQAINPADKTQRQGNVYLAAPAGVVNAGEAGISGGQVVIAATAVIGASNIQATGGTVGVPTAVAAPVVPAGADSAAAGAAKSATQNATRENQENKDEERGRKAGASILSADVVGYGQCSVTEVREGKPGCGG